MICSKQFGKSNETLFVAAPAPGRVGKLRNSKKITKIHYFWEKRGKFTKNQKLPNKKCHKGVKTI